MSATDITAFSPAETTSDDPRRLRGLEIAALSRVRQDGDHWSVPSQSGQGVRYRVYPDEGRCSCPDHELRQVRCKHLWAVSFTIERETQPDGSEVVRKSVRVTFAQDWTAYNSAQVEEGERFRLMLADLCRTIEQPEQRTGRPRLALGDMVFSAALKTYTGFSSRRFSSELRAAHEAGLIERVPHFNSVNNYLSDPALTPVLKDLVALSAMPLSGIERDFAVDSSGFGTTGFVRWYSKKYDGVTDNREWVKAHIAVGVETHIVTSIEVSDWTSNDNPYLPGLVQDTARRFEVREVSADKQYIGRSNLAAIEAVGAQPFIPFKSNSITKRSDEGSAWERLFFYFAYHRADFLEHYHKRSNVETAFSMIKRKFGPAVRSKSHEGQINEVLAKVLCHNLVVVIHAMHEAGLDCAEVGFCTETLAAAQEVRH